MLRKPFVPSRTSAPGSLLLILSTLVAAAAAALGWPTGNAILCDRLAPLAAVAALAAALIALCFRALSRASARSLPLAALLLASLALFLSARFVIHTYAACQAVQEQLRQLRRQP